MRLRSALGISAVVVSIVTVGAIYAGDAVRSGLEPGDFVNPFDVDDITGPNQGKTLCYRWQYGASPVVCVFARKTSEPLASLVKQIDKRIDENNQLKSFVVVLGGEPDRGREELRKLAHQNGIKHVPLTMFGDPGGPGQYDLSRNADITVLMWKTHKVKVNHAYKGELTEKDIGEIVRDIPKLLGD